MHLSFELLSLLIFILLVTILLVYWVYSNKVSKSDDFESINNDLIVRIEKLSEGQQQLFGGVVFSICLIRVRKRLGATRQESWNN